MLQIKSENNTESRKKRMQIKREKQKYMKIELMFILNQRDREFERKERAGCIMKYNKKKYTQKGDRGREF